MLVPYHGAVGIHVLLIVIVILCIPIFLVSEWLHRGPEFSIARLLIANREVNTIELWDPRPHGKSGEGDYTSA